MCAAASQIGHSSVRALPKNSDFELAVFKKIIKVIKKSIIYTYIIIKMNNWK